MQNEQNKNKNNAMLNFNNELPFKKSGIMIKQTALNKMNRTLRKRSANSNFNYFFFLAGMATLIHSFHTCN